MLLHSTRNANNVLNSTNAIIKGIAEDGGLYFPLKEDLENNKFDVKNLLQYSYKELALHVFKIFFSEFTTDELLHCINCAYNKNNFKEYDDIIAPVTKIGDNYLLELYHGPTSAFKDMALTILPHFLTTAYRKIIENKKVYILTATSGDTGKAALSGFKNVENTFITVFYPTDGVSNMQKLQMQTAEGNNVSVVAINGNFDDCQHLVKEIYADANIHKICEKNGIVLSSANSINIGRLVPQIVYYINAYVRLVNENRIQLYDKINFVVPTGNFGDILAGYIAKILGLPINKLICASNTNNILTDFITTGVYDANREFFKTISPSMDILVSSNLERLLYLISNNNSEFVKQLMNELNTNKKYTISEEMQNKIKSHFSAYYATENECKEAIRDAFEKDKRLIDPHTAVAYVALNKYLQDNPEDKKLANVILSTASPYKFTKAVLGCLSNTNLSNVNDFECMNILKEVSNEAIPENLMELNNKKILFNTSLSYEDAKKYIINLLENKNA